jgi:transporter family protein
VAPIDKSSVAMVLVLSVLILGEPISWKSVAGTIAIVIGVLLFIL